MKIVLVLFSALVALAVQMNAQSDMSLMPVPASLRAGAGDLAITQSFTVAVSGHDDARVRNAAQRLVMRLSRETGIPITAKIGESSRATLLLTAEKASEHVQKLGEDESYKLEVTPSGARITAPNALGVLRGVETFLQLAHASPDGFVVPAVVIEDHPRFPWRGLMIDSCRHWIPVEVIKRNLDGMAAVKLNALHWHLSEDQAFRIESKRFPKLHELGAGGFFYTQEQVRDVIAYAHDRGIRVVPEFDMPGHTTAWFVGHPELASAPGPYQIERRFGIFDPAMDPTREQTYKFLDKFIGEMAKLFPDEFFHIGGDEVNGKQWDSNPRIQAFKQKHGMKSNADLQAWFNKRVQGIVAKHHKTMIGWDEVVHPDLPRNVLVQSWRGKDSLANAVRHGYRTILSNGYYLDLLYPASQHYAVDPRSANSISLTPEEQERILGGEAAMWSELVTAETVDSRIWPRNAAIAERFWSPQNVTDVDSMYRRLAAVSQELEWLGLTHNSYYPLSLTRIASPTNVRPLSVLADILEPPKGYKRHHLDVTTTETAYNRLVDVLRPESNTVRMLSQVVDRVIAGKASAEEKARLHAQFAEWRDNDKQLQPVLQTTFLLKELAPVSQQVSTLATAALQALDYLESGQPAPAAWTQQQLAATQEASKPHASLLIMIADPVRRLIAASSPTRATGGK